jgi:hypothetical protein
MTYVWYLGYGSNLHKQRFLCYVKGGIPQFGKNRNNGCNDKTSPLEDKAITINYPLYFALPDSQTGTGNWGVGGVAFIDPQENKQSKTLCRMWKITEGQYGEVKLQEGSGWYNKEISLGEDDGIPILTITHDPVLTNIAPPSDTYIKTIAFGFRETYRFTVEQIVDYLLGKPGVQGRIEKDRLIRIVVS